MAVLLETTLGDVVIDLYTEERPRGEACTLLSPDRAAGPLPLGTELGGIGWSFCCTLQGCS